MRKSSFVSLAVGSSVAATAAAITLAHRLPMLGFATFWSTAERQAEAARMVEEKTAALATGIVNANLEAARVLTAASLGNFAALRNAPATIAAAGLRPAYRTVRANARRLSRKAARKVSG